MALSTVFYSINYPDNSPFSHSVLPVLSLCLTGPFNYISLYESLLQPRYNPLWLTGLKTLINNLPIACTNIGIWVYVCTDCRSSVKCWRLQNFTVQPESWGRVVVVTADGVVQNTAGTSLVSRVAVASLRPADFISWLPVSMLGASVSVCCVAIRAVIQFFHVCSSPVVPAVVSVMCCRSPLCHKPSTGPYHGCSLP